MREKINGNTVADIYSFDFRSRQDDVTINGGVASIWLASITGDDGQTFYDSIDGFLDGIFELSKSKNICLYCFDLAFHWSFIFYGLIHRGFIFTKRFTKTSAKCFSAFGTMHATVVYSASIKNTKTGGSVYFKDLKQVYAGFRNIEEMAESFKSDRKFFPDDLEKAHPEGGKPTEEELSNSSSRSGFIFDVLKRQEDDPEFFRAFTLASHSIKAAIKYGFRKLHNPYAAYRSSRMYPNITDEDQKAALRESIKGGLAGPTIAALDAGLEIDKPMFVIDRTQSYPSEMNSSLLPRGVGERFEGMEIGPYIYLYQVKIKSFDYAIFHSLPVLMQYHIHFMPEEADPIILWLWHWEYWKAFSCYKNLQAEVLGGYRFKKGKCPFWEYVAKNQEERKALEAKGDHIGAAHVKALNVSIYGKLIQRDSTEKISQKLDDESGIMDTESEERKEAKEASYIYLPAGSAIPSLARLHMIEKAEEFGFDNVMYIETDCLIVLDNADTRAVLEKMELSKDLNHWHLEALAKEAYFPMAKRYKYLKEDGTAVVKGAGIDVSQLGEAYDDISIVNNSVIMRMKKRAKGGMLLVKVKKNLKGENKK